MRAIDRVGSAASAPVPPEEPVADWGQVAALAPHWRPRPEEGELEPVQGRLSLHRDGLVFRADAAVDRETGEPVAELVPAAVIVGAGPPSPGSPLTSTRTAGEWMPRLLRRFRCPGFVVSTADGPWVFDGPHGLRRQEEVRRRFAAGVEAR